MPESILERLRAKAWGEDGPHRKRAVHLEVAEAAVREAGAECDDLARLLDEAIEREKALEAKILRYELLDKALIAKRRAEADYRCACDQVAELQAEKRAADA